MAGSRLGRVSCRDSAALDNSFSVREGEREHTAKIDAMRTRQPDRRGTRRLFNAAAMKDRDNRLTASTVFTVFRHSNDVIGAWQQFHTKTVITVLVNWKNAALPTVDRKQKYCFGNRKKRLLGNTP